MWHYGVAVHAGLLRVEVDGRNATDGDLRSLALINYGHFTVMQIRQGRTRGLRLHLQRLAAATRELFETGMEPQLVCDRIRQALAGEANATVRVTIFRPDGRQRVAVMVAVRPPVDPVTEPVRLMSVQYQRAAAHLKHVGTFGLFYYGERAERAGFDDALLAAVDGSISEAATSNIGFYDGATIVWPDAPHLPGITMQLLQAAFRDTGIASRHEPVRLADLDRFRAAFITDSRGVAPVCAIDDVTLSVDDRLMEQLTGAYDTVAWDVI